MVVIHQGSATLLLSLFIFSGTSVFFIEGSFARVYIKHQHQESDVESNVSVSSEELDHTTPGLAEEEPHFSNWVVQQSITSTTAASFSTTSSLIPFSNSLVVACGFHLYYLGI